MKKRGKTKVNVLRGCRKCGDGYGHGTRNPDRFCPCWKMRLPRRKEK